MSTEQILHFDRYAAGDRPVRLRFRDEADGGPGLAEDVVGELEVQMLIAQLAGAASLARPAPLGWGGDRYRLIGTPAGAALVWYLVWDDPESAAAFRKGTGTALAARRLPGYRVAFDTLTLSGAPADRYVVAPPSGRDGSACRWWRSSADGDQSRLPPDVPRYRRLPGRRRAAGVPERTDIQIGRSTGSDCGATAGYPRDAKLVIIHADDIGFCHAVNRAAITAFDRGAINSGSIMVPCPGFEEFAGFGLGSASISACI